MQTVDMDYDDDIDPDAPTFVFEGPMTNKRALLWRAFTSQTGSNNLQVSMNTNAENT